MPSDFAVDGLSVDRRGTGTGTGRAVGAPSFEAGHWGAAGLRWPSGVDARGRRRRWSCRTSCPSSPSARQRSEGGAAVLDYCRARAVTCRARRLSQRWRVRHALVALASDVLELPRAPRAHNRRHGECVRHRLPALSQRPTVVDAGVLMEDLCYRLCLLGRGHRGCAGWAGAAGTGGWAPARSARRIRITAMLMIRVSRAIPAATRNARANPVARAWL